MCVRARTWTALNAIYVGPNFIMEIESILEPRLALNSPCPRMALNPPRLRLASFQSPCLSLPSAGMRGLHHHLDYTWYHNYSS